MMLLWGRKKSTDNMQPQFPSYKSLSSIFSLIHWIWLCIFAGVYSSSSVSDGIYEGTMGMEQNLDNLDDMIMTQPASQTAVTSNGNSSNINPIDKLYSMQNSYFTGEWHLREAGSKWKNLQSIRRLYAFTLCSLNLHGIDSRKERG